MLVTQSQPQSVGTTPNNKTTPKTLQKHRRKVQHLTKQHNIPFHLHCHSKCQPVRTVNTTIFHTLPIRAAFATRTDIIGAAAATGGR
jgi:hypothetical protein